MLYLALNNKLQKTNGGKVLSSNPVECRWNYRRPSANELDLGEVPRNDKVR
jgi:hypothetical protein